MELVRREKGFTLYVNGANAATTGLMDAGGKTTRAAGPKTSRTKTAGTVGSNCKSFSNFFFRLRL